MKYFNVDGMSCAACSSRVERAVSAVTGVSSCCVNLLTNSMSVEGDVNTSDIIAAVERAGYRASEKDEEKRFSQKNTKEKDETQALVKRLILSVAILVVLMYFSMGYVMWSFPVPPFFEESFIYPGILQMLLSLSVLIVNRRFFINGIKGVINKAPNMDTLVAMGSGISFLYSLCVLIKTAFYSPSADFSATADFLHNLYFEAAAMIPALITLGKLLEAYSKGKTTNSIKGLMKLTPDKATKLVDGEEKTVGVSEIEVGDTVVIRAGESIPVDGTVTDGEGTVNEAMLTGESIPVEKSVGDRVSAGTVSLSGYMKFKATEVGNDTMLSGIIKTVSEASSTKAPVAKTADKVAGVFVPFVLLVSVITTVIWLILGESFGFALERGISVLVISCPCALGLATPVAIMVGSGIGASNGILYKTALSLELAGKINAIALDKTGTITKGRPVVTEIIPFGQYDEDKLLQLAFSLEIKSEHPLARAICEKARETGKTPDDIEDFKAFTGNGVSAVMGGSRKFAGNRKFIQKNVKFDEKAENIGKELAADGKTPVFFCDEKELIGIIALADEIKEDSREAIRQLKNMGIYVAMLTGDNKRTAEAIGKQVGVDTVFSDVLPEQKLQIIASLQKNSITAMVGDGINDAPALTKADVGIAIGAGTDIAMDSADIVLIKSSLIDAVKAIRLGRLVLNNIRQNLFWAFGYNLIGIPLAAGAFTAFLGWSMNPMFGAAAMSISSFLVVTNALRLNAYNVASDKRDRKIRKKALLQEEKVMIKTMKIEGMMCCHCEARVKKTLEAVDGVSEASVSHETGTAVLTLSKDVSDNVLVSAVTEQDYKVISIS